MKIKKKILSILMALVLIITTALPIALLETCHAYGTTTVTTASQLINAINSASTDMANPTDIIISSNITLAAKLSIPAGRYVKLKGTSTTTTLTITGTYLSAQASTTDAMVMVSGELTVESLVMNAASKLRVVSVNKGGHLILNAGAKITGGYLGDKGNTAAGAGVAIVAGSPSKPGIVTMNSGSSITNNKASGEYPIFGVGVYMGAYGQFTMTGGTISNNIDCCTKNSRYFSNGGGLYLDSYGGYFSMTGGTITGNSAKGNGGGVYINQGTFNLSGGTISKNKTTTAGGGVYVLDKLNITAGNITGNTAVAEELTSNYGCGAGVYVDSVTSNQTGELNTVGEVNMTGGSISGNTATSVSLSNTYNLVTGEGGGVFDRGLFSMSGGVIEKNTATANNGGGISVAGGAVLGTFTISGGTISENIAGENGGGIYLHANETTIGTTSPYSPTTVEEQGVLQLQGLISISGNMGNGSSDNLFLQQGSTATCLGAFDSNSNIYLGGQSTALNTEVIVPADDYEITPEDARVIKNNLGESTYALSKEGNIVLCEKRTTPYTSLESATVSDIEDQVFTGSAIRPEPTVELSGVPLVKGEDYVLSYSLADNVNVGVAKIKIIGTGDYDGSITREFNIVTKAIGDTAIGAVRDRIYTGQPIEPKVAIKNGETSLVEGTDYSLTYTENIQVGQGHILITGKGNYSGTISVDFNIVPKDNQVIVANEKELDAAIETATGTESSPQIIYIDGEISITDGLDVEAGKYITLLGEGDGAAITLASSQDSMITVEQNLKVENVTLDANYMGRVVKVSTSGDFVIGSDATLTNGWALMGSGVYNLGNVKLEGGTISGNSNIALGYGSGGGLYNAGTFTLSSGTISENANTKGGGIFNLGMVLINGGTIKNNSANGSELNSAAGEGGGIFNEDGGTITINDGAIQNNTATEYGGGICNQGTLKLIGGSLNQNTAVKAGGGVYTSNTFVMENGDIVGNLSNSKVISRIQNCGGGVYLDAGTFTMNGGEIHGNIVRNRYQSSTFYASLGNGGGVYVSNDRENPCVFTMNDGEIYDNSAISAMTGNETGHGGGVYIMGGNSGEADTNTCYPGTFYMRGGTISNNTASDRGSGVYANNKELACNSGSFTTPISIDYQGNSLVYFSGPIKIKDNTGDNLFLTAQEVVFICGALTGDTETIGVSSASNGDVIIGTGEGYLLTDTDVNKFKNDKGLRPIALNSLDNEIDMVGLRLEGSYAINVESSFVYTGEAITPPITVKNISDNTILEEGKDYEVSYEDNPIDTGTYFITVTGTGDYVGTLEAQYVISPKTLSTVVASMANQEYTGSAIQAVPAAGSVKDGDVSLLRNTDYRIVSGSYINNIRLGTASFQIEGIGNYSGTKTITFKIVKSMYKLGISGIYNKVYTGKALTQSVVVKDGSTILKNGTDYTVAYKNNIVPGKATMTITGKGNYQGYVTWTFKIVPKKATLVSLKSLKTRQLTVTWKRDSLASGYKVVIGTNSACTKNVVSKIFTSNKTTSKTFTKLLKGKVYYAKVRAYKVIDGKRYYGAYSDVRKLKIK